MQSNKSRQLFLLFPMFLLASCGSISEQQVPGAQLARIELAQSAPIVGQPLSVAIKGFDAADQEISVDPASLVWKSGNEKLLQVIAPGQLMPLAVGETDLTVQTRDGRVSFVYPEKVWPKNAFRITSESVKV